MWYENTEGINGTVRWGRQISVTDSARRPQSIAVADIDRDGKLDLASANDYGNELAWYKNENRDGTGWTKQVVSKYRNLRLLLLQISILTGTLTS